MRAGVSVGSGGDRALGTRGEILRLLADGELHSGADIGRRLGISRAAVSKGVKGLSAKGLAVRAVPGVGYRLEAPLTPLDRGRILRWLKGTGSATARIEILEQTDSTNRYLLERALVDADPSGRVCLAEVQPRGRGRRGKSWIATPYENLLMSMAWRFAAGPALVSGLSLAAGVAVARALESYGIAGVGLKWPNDVLWRAPGELLSDDTADSNAAGERKLAGLLIDVHGEASGPCTVVLGVGVNCRMAGPEGYRVDQPWVDLRTITGRTPDRNRLAALLIRELQDMFTTFGCGGLGAFQRDWERRHLYARRSVRIAQGDVSFEGTVEGIDADGALRLRDARGDTRLFHSGEISLRVLP